MSFEIEFDFSELGDVSFGIEPEFDELGDVISNIIKKFKVSLPPFAFCEMMCVKMATTTKMQKRSRKA